MRPMGCRAMPTKKQQPTDELLLQAIACGSTVKQGASAAGISERTAARRMADPLFRARLDAMRLEFVERSTRMLSAVGPESIKTLMALQQQTVAEPVRLGAAKAALTLGIKFRESYDLSMQVAALLQSVKILESERKLNHDFAESAQPNSSPGKSHRGVDRQTPDDDAVDPRRSDGHSDDVEVGA